MPRGGKRPGAGAKKGSKHASTLQKEALAKAMQAEIAKHMPRMLKAQVEAACGVAHLFLRAEDGTFSKAPEGMTADEIERVLNGDPNRYFIATKDPNTQAFNTLSAYGAGKPQEPSQQVDVDATLEIRWQS